MPVSAALMKTIGLLGFCLNITHITLKASIFRNYQQTEVTDFDVHKPLLDDKVDALLKAMELQESAQRKGHFALFNCLVIGHTKYKGVQRVYCNPFPVKLFYGSHQPRHDKAAGYR